jgi:NAD(P)-dependent dehydrogenase (short-subunit alcohol dehydrogenase family)
LWQGKRPVNLKEKIPDHLQSGIRGIGGAIVFRTQDVSVERDWLTLTKDIEGTEGGLDVLVNNAGIAPVASLEETSLELWQQIMRVNAQSVFLGMKACLPLLKNRMHARSGGSAIVNLASMLAKRGVPNTLAYAASKAAISQMGKAAAVEFARLRYSIRVNNVLPGMTVTPMIVDQVNNWLGVQSDSPEDLGGALNTLAQRMPVGRLATPENIADAVIFLSSPASAYITGIDLPVDGGRSAA